MQTPTATFRKRPLTASAVLLLLCLASGACGTWLRNPKKPTTTTSATMSLRVVAKLSSALTSPSSISVTDDNGKTVGSLSLASAKVILKEVSLKRGTGDEQVGGSFPGPYVVDLLSGDIAPAIEDVNVTPGTYDAVELTLARLSAADVDRIALPAELEGASLYFTGDLTLGDGPTRPFELSLDFDDEFSVPLTSPGTGLSVASGEHLPLALVFPVDQWLAKSGNALASVSGDAVVLTTAAGGSAQAAREQIRRNIETTAAFRRDNGE